MANYVSTHTGAEIDAAVDAAIPFEAVYGSTTYAEIKAAHDAKRTVSARKGFQRFQLANFVAAAISFSLANAGTKTITLLTVTNADVWSEVTLDIGAELAAIQAASSPAILNTASGAVCSFPDGSAAPMTSVIANIVAKQDAPILPAGYWQLDYIASSGTQYIDTLYKIASEKVRYVGKFNFSATSSSMRLFGREKPKWSGILFNTTGRLYAGSTADILAHGEWATNTDYDVDLTLDNGNATLIVNGATQTGTYTGEIASSLYPIYLLACNSNAQGAPTGQLSAEIYYFKIYDNGLLVRDFVPCIRQADGVLGMYDLVGGAFYANAGTGDFIAGPPTSRPISGFTGANVTRAGANVWDEQWELGGIDPSTGETTVAADRIRSKNFIRVAPSTSYYFKDGHLSGYSLRLFFYDANQNFVSDSGWLNASGAFTTGADVCYMKFIDASVTTYTSDISVNYPSSLTSYYPYAGEVFSVSWQDAAGTVYGGNTDIVKGVVGGTRTKARLTLDSTIPAGTAGIRDISELANGVRFEYYPYRAIGSATDNEMMSDKFAFGDTSTGTPFTISGANGSARLYLCLPSEYNTDALIRQWFADNPTEVIYPLATPETFSFEPVPIESLLGKNNVWNDVGGDTSATYRADTKLYIQSLLGA